MRDLVAEKFGPEIVKLNRGRLQCNNSTKSLCKGPDQYKDFMSYINNIPNINVTRNLQPLKLYYVYIDKVNRPIMKFSFVEVGS